MHSLQEKDRRYIWHPFTSFTGSPGPIPIVQGKGVYLTDENGTRYIDAISSWWVNLHGHGHPYIAEKIYHQALELEQVIFAGFTHRPAIELAERLIPLLPGNFDKIFYSDNGSTATEVAIKMALQYWWNKALQPGELKRTKILAFTDAYHGDTFGAMSVSDRSVFTSAFSDKLFDVVFIDKPDANNISAVQAVIECHAAETAAFIYEPLVQGAGGMQLYDPQFMQPLLETCSRHEIICIADEVMTGFGRTGRLFASAYMHQKPDIICLSKGLTGGTMALGVTACTARITAAFMSDDKYKTFFHGHSFTANPLACTAALASLDLLQKDSCLQQIQAIARQQSAFIEKIQQHPAVKNPRCLGTIAAFEYHAARHDYLDTVSADITAFMLNRGIYLRPLGNTVYIMPPYCITGTQLQKVHEAILDYISGKTE